MVEIKFADGKVEELERNASSVSEIIEEIKENYEVEEKIKKPDGIDHYGYDERETYTYTYNPIIEIQVEDKKKDDEFWDNFKKDFMPN